MLKIHKMRADHVVDFAAEELKKYLRMMMPECGDIDIAYTPDAKDGFRLGLLEDFDLPFEGEDAVLDDVVHIETDEKAVPYVVCIEKDGALMMADPPISLADAVKEGYLD